MKKTFLFAALMALTLASCGNKTNNNAATNDSTNIETTDTMSGQAKTNGEEADAQLKVDDLKADLQKAIEGNDAKATASALNRLQEAYKKLLAEGKLNEAQKVGEAIKRMVADNQDALKGIANGNATINDLVSDIKNIPDNAEATAKAAAEVINNAPEAAKQAAEKATTKAVNDAKQAATNKANAAVEKAKSKAANKINEANKKANDAANKALKGLGL